MQDAKIEKKIFFSKISRKTHWSYFDEALYMFEISKYNSNDFYEIFEKKIKLFFQLRHSVSLKSSRFRYIIMLVFRLEFIYEN